MTPGLMEELRTFAEEGNNYAAIMCLIDIVEEQQKQIDELKQQVEMLTRMPAQRGYLTTDKGTVYPGGI